MRSPLAQRDWGRFGIGHDDYSHAHVERKHSHRNFAAANSLSLCLCVCMCMCVRACIQYNMNMLQIPATTESCPGQELKNQVRPCGLAMQCDRPRFDIRHCSSNHFWHSEHGKAGRLSFCFSACFPFCLRPELHHSSDLTWTYMTYPNCVRGRWCCRHFCSLACGIWDVSQGVERLVFLVLYRFLMLWIPNLWIQIKRRLLSFQCLVRNGSCALFALPRYAQSLRVRVRPAWPRPVSQSCDRYSRQFKAWA